MTENANEIFRFTSNAVATFATAFSWFYAFGSQGVTAVLGLFAPVPAMLGPDEKAAIFAGIAAGSYWSLMFINKAWRIYKSYKQSKEESNERKD